MKYLTLFIIALLGVATSLKAQQKKTLYQFDANAFMNDDRAAYKTGVGFTAGVYWPLSPSFNLGPAVSADFLKLRSTSANYTPVSVRLVVVWFPEKLMNSIIPLPAWSLLYFKTGLGHAFNYSAISDKDLLNSSSFDFGFMLPAKTKVISLHAGLATYGVKTNGVFTGADNSVVPTLGISYNLFGYKKQEPAQ